MLALKLAPEGGGWGTAFIVVASSAQVCTVMTRDNCESILECVVMIWTVRVVQEPGLLPAQAGSGMSGAEQKAAAGEPRSWGWSLVCGLRRHSRPNYLSSVCTRIIITSARLAIVGSNRTIST